MIIRNRTFENNEGGSAIVAVAVAMSALAAVSLMVLQLGVAARGEQRSQVDRVHAQYTAEAALAASLVELQNGGDGVVFDNDQPLTLGGASAFVGVADVGSGNFGLVANGSMGNQEFAAEVVTGPSAVAFWQFGAFGDEGLLLNSNAQADSYDSTTGPYADINGSGSNSYANTNGSVGSNADVAIDGNVKVWGDVVAGPSGSFYEGSKTQVSGSLINAPAVQEMPTITVPSGVSAGSLTTPSAGYSIGSGLTVLDELRVDGALTIVGPAEVVCENLIVESNTEIIVDDSAGPVTIYVHDDFIMNSNTSIAPLSKDPAMLELELLSDNILDPAVDVDFTEAEIEFDSNAKVYGTIYAPNAALVLDSNFELFGAVAARLLMISSNALVHFDENLINKTDDEDSTWEIVGWRVTGVGL